MNDNAFFVLGLRELPKIANLRQQPHVISVYALIA